MAGGKIPITNAVITCLSLFLEEGIDKKLEHILNKFFGNNKRLLWCEPPYSEEGKKAGVYHYRLFCDENWQPIFPRGEPLHLLREPDIFETNMKLFCAKDLEDAFIAGAEWQSRQMAWISVNDKLPEYGHIIDDLTIYSHTKNVIVLYKNGCIGKGKRIYVNEINKKSWQWSCLKGEDITHWMYFPD